MSPNIVERTLQHFRRQRFGLARSYHFAAEAKATIDGADVRCLKQHAIRIAMDNSLDRTPGIVAYRIDTLARLLFKFRRIGNKLPRDRILGIVRINQLSQMLRQSNGIARANSFQSGLPLWRREALLAKLRSPA